MSTTVEQHESHEMQHGPWREVPAPRNKPVNTAVAKWLFRHAFGQLPLRVELADGLVMGSGDPDAPVMRILDEPAFFQRLGADGQIGFGESFMVGEWDADDPPAVLEPLAARLATLAPAWMRRLRRISRQPVPSQNENTLTGARRNIEQHYDLSNDLFALFLDESMTYSSALFAPGDTIDLAQMRKVDRILGAVGVGPGTRLLEIGTGWGALAIRAAQRGAQVTTLTLSRAQQALARQRVASAGLNDRVDIQLRDYRDAQGTYDAVVSVEMIEAVGERYWPDYFVALDRLVAPGGKVGLQAIVLDHDRLAATRGQLTWISKYIFPGGALPSSRLIGEHVRDHTTLHISERFAFGASYAQTLRCWRERFDAHAEQVEALGFDRTFRRMWDLYFSYAEAGFVTGYLDVEQVVLSR